MMKETKMGKLILAVVILTFGFTGLAFAQATAPVQGQQTVKVSSNFVKLPGYSVVVQVVTDPNGNILATQAYTMTQLQTILDGIDKKHDTDRSQVVKAIGLMLPAGMVASTSIPPVTAATPAAKK